MENMAKDFSYSFELPATNDCMPMLTQAKANGMTSLVRNQLLTQKWRKTAPVPTWQSVWLHMPIKHMDSSFRPNYIPPPPGPRSLPLAQSWQRFNMAAFLASVCPVSKWWCSPLSTVTQEFGAASFPGARALTALRFIPSPSAPLVLDSFSHLFLSPFRFSNTSPSCPAKRW